MERFERVVIGYHGCTEKFARDLLMGDLPINQWRPSTNRWDWLGHGIYFWEHSSARALRWAQGNYQGSDHVPSVIGAVVQLGRCFDLLDEAVTSLLANSYEELVETFAIKGRNFAKKPGQGPKTTGS